MRTRAFLDRDPGTSPGEMRKACNHHELHFHIRSCPRRTRPERVRSGAFGPCGVDGINRDLTSSMVSPRGRVLQSPVRRGHCSAGIVRDGQDRGANRRPARIGLPLGLPCADAGQVVRCGICCRVTPRRVKLDSHAPQKVQPILQLPRTVLWRSYLVSEGTEQLAPARNGFGTAPSPRAVPWEEGSPCTLRGPAGGRRHRLTWTDCRPSPSREVA